MKALAKLTIAAAIAVSSVAANAGTVLVYGNRYDLNNINTFYNTYGGHTSTIAPSLTSASLTGVNLLWAVQPASAYTPGELTTMANFLSGGGRIAFMGEHGSFLPDENLRINAALTALGASIQIINNLADSGFRSASVGDGQILAHPLTTGVNTYQYAAFAPLTVSGSAQVLMRGEENPNDIMMAYQNIGAGSIFLITDQNVWDNRSTLWGAFDNETMFDNLVQGITGAPPVSGAVPEPATWLMMIMGFGLVGGSMRRKRQTVQVSYG